MEQKLGLPGSQPADFDVFPSDPPRPPRSERLESGFFRGEAGREVDFGPGARPAVRGFGLGIDSTEEAVAESLHGFGDPVVLDHVDTDSDGHKTRVMLHTYRESHITFLRSPALGAIPGVAHAFSTRREAGGDVTLDHTASDARSRFLTAAGMAGWPLSGVRQVHSNTAHAVRENGFANERPEGDALFTRLGGMALGVVTADCVPILLAHRSGRAVAAIHAGWRGTSEGVARVTVDRMVAEAGLDPGRLAVAIGPHIGICCMEVGEEVYEWFQDPDVFERRPGWPRPHLNLGEANRKQLEAAGVPAESIEVSGLCTRCRSDLFHSYRRDGSAAGRMLSVIGIEAV